jgi:hypothetical protein
MQKLSVGQDTLSNWEYTGVVVPAPAEAGDTAHSAASSTATPAARKIPRMRALSAVIAGL